MAEKAGGYVAEIVRYPVKGLGGESVSSTSVSSAGIPFDRAFGLANDRAPLAPFGQWSTYDAFHALDARPDLAGYAASIDAARLLEIRSPSGGELRFQVGEGGELDVAPIQAETITDWFGTPTSGARLIASGFHLWDLEDAPISIINLATLRALEREAGARLDPRRFRANLFLDGVDPWEELSFRGRHLHVGGVVMEVLRPIERCRAITVDPGDGTTDVNVLAVLGGRFGHIFCGMYARVVSAGTLTAGDRVRIGSPVDEPAAQDLTPHERTFAPRIARVAAVSAPAADVVSLEIVDSAGELAHAQPGQYLRLHRTTADAPSWRNYTISRVSGASSRITVQKKADGRFSPWVHELRADDQVAISGPYGDVTLADEADEVVLLTAGIGITLALAILERLALSPGGKAVRALHVARTRRSAPHLDEYFEAIHAVGGTARLHLTREPDDPDAHRGRPNQAAVESLIDDRRHVRVIICGPVAFETEMRSSLSALGVPDDHVVSDPFYSPRDDVAESRPAPLPSPFTVTFAEGSERIEARWTPESGTLLDVAEAVGVPALAACRAGACGTCVMAVHGSTAYLTDPVFEPRPGTVLVCSAVPTDDVVMETRLN